MASVIASVVDTFAQNDAEQRIVVATRHGLRVLTYDNDMFEIVRNLLDNARNYAPDSPVEISTDVIDDWILLVVRDRGAGMAKQDLAHALNRFYRGLGIADIEGLGLGLAIVTRTVQRSRGSVAIESAIGGRSPHYRAPATYDAVTRVLR